MDIIPQCLDREKRNFTFFISCEFTSKLQSKSTNFPLTISTSLAFGVRAPETEAASFFDFSVKKDIEIFAGPGTR